MSEHYKELEKNLSRKLRQWIVGFSCAFLFIGIGLGFLAFNQKSIAETPENVRLAPEMLSASFADVAKQVEPAVVNIDTKGKILELGLKGEKPGAVPDDILEFFKRQLPRRPSYAVGSGFIVDRQGYILTNSHVVEDSSRITVRLQNGDEFTARIIGSDEETDLAVLKIDAGRDLPSVKLGDSNAAEVGDWVLAVGSPFGLAQTVTAGIISQVNRETPYSGVRGFPNKFIQTDAAINRGNSGGPLVNMNGEVVGVNSQIATSTGDYNGIGFALPSNEAAYVYRQILQGGKVKRGYLGVTLDSLKPEFAKVYGLPEAKGAIITDLLDRQSPAGKAGLQINDIIVEFNNQPVMDAQDLIAKIAATEPEKEAALVYLRETGDKLERRNTVIKLGLRPPNRRSSASAEVPEKLNNGETKLQLAPLGLTLLEFTPQLGATYKFNGMKGVIVKEIDPASFMADLKNSSGGEALNEGDLIRRINRVEVKDLKTFNEVASRLKTGDPVVLHVSSYNKFIGTVQQRIVQFTVQ